MNRKAKDKNAISQSEPKAKEYKCILGADLKTGIEDDGQF